MDINYEDDFEEYPDEVEVQDTNSFQTPLKNDGFTKSIGIESSNKRIDISNRNCEEFSTNFKDSLLLNKRNRRFKKLIEEGILEMQEEKLNQLNILPSRLCDIYYRKLRFQNGWNTNSSVNDENNSSNNSGIKQCGTSTRKETCDTDTNTEDITIAEKSVQFAYGNDDTLFHDTIRVIKTSKSLVNQKSEMVNSTGRNNLAIYNILSLSNFLQKSSSLFDHLLEENKIQTGRKPLFHKSKSNSLSLQAMEYSLLDGYSSWELFGSQSYFNKEIILNRNLVSFRSSQLQPGTIVTTHVYSTLDGSNDLSLKAHKGIFCIWDSNQPYAPTLVLEAVGRPTVCCFSATDISVLVAGCDDGTLVLWDLSQDYNREKGFRKPSFRTCYTIEDLDSIMNTKLDTMSSEDIQTCHVASIIQIEALRGNDYYNNDIRKSNFVSMDATGTIIFWETKNIDKDLINNKTDIYSGLSPWSTIVLVCTRCIRTGILSCPFGTIPGSTSSIYIPDWKGSVRQIDRYNTVKSCPLSLDKKSTLLTDSNSSKKNIEFQKMSSTKVTFIAVRKNLNKITNSFKDVNSLINEDRKDGESKQYGTNYEYNDYLEDSSTLVLVGKSNGELELYLELNASKVLIYKWRLSSCLSAVEVKTNRLNCPGHSSSDLEFEIAVEYICWCPDRASAFFVIMTDGTLIYFDLLIDPFHPIGIESIPVHDDLYRCKNKFEIFLVKVGREKNLMLVVSTVDKSNCHTIRSHRISDDKIKLCTSSRQLNDEDTKFRGLVKNLMGHYTY